MYYLDTASSSRLYPYSFTEDCNFNPNSQYIDEQDTVISLLKSIFLVYPNLYNVYVYSSCTQANQDIQNLGSCFTFEYSHPSLVKNSSLETAEILSMESVVSETGEILDIPYWTEYAKNKVLHLDITSSLMLDMKYTADILTFSTYKLGVPIGLSFMFIRKNININNLHFSKGTFPLLLTKWFIKSLQEARYCIDSVRFKALELKTKLDKIARPILTNKVSPYILAYEFDVNIDILYPVLIKNGVLCSRGASCRNGKQSIAYKLLGCNPKNVLRFSINHLTTSMDIKGADVVVNLYGKMK